ncbi:tol-pal system protein YbgF [Castellaniella sp.]|uniref:tol-pal system protein YbgF n=1 Tax=Castellaniella sp. TaxID=1955812 RepID=UPI003564CF78
MLTAYLPLSARASVLVLALSLLSPAAQAFSDDEARRAIIELRAQIKQMNEQSQQARIQLSNQMDQLQQEVAALRGRIEEIGGRPAAAQRAAGPQASAGADPQQRAVYEAAADLYRNGRYAEAASGFASFVGSYPDSPMIGDALFYLGSSQYASKRFADSVKSMNTLVQQHPNDPHAPDALLVAAISQIELNDMKGAKASLQRILDDYPGSSAAETARNRIKLL